MTSSPTTIGLSRRFAIVLAAILSMALLTMSQQAAASTKKSRAAHKTSHVHKTHRRVKSTHHKHVQTSADDSPGSLALKSHAALVIDQDSGETLVMKNPDATMPIASLTKLMTALVVLDAKLPMDEELQISDDDVDRIRYSHSRLRVGTRLTREQMLLLALMSSENRAAMSLSRNYPGGRKAFIAQMNAKARALGMSSSHFADPAGLSNGSYSTARDLQHLVKAAYQQPVIRRDTTQEAHSVRVGRRMVHFINSNRLVRGGNWDIGLQKTGYTNDAGRCLIMQATVEGRRLAMIFLDSWGALTRYADAARVRRHVESMAARESASSQ